MSSISLSTPRPNSLPSGSFTGLRRRLLRWGRRNYREFPWRKTKSAYEIAVAEILLKRTTATAAARAFPQFIDTYPTVWTLAKADRKQLTDVLQPVGLFNQRASSLISLSSYVCNHEDGRFPRSLARLLKIPGLGDYSARAVLSFVYGSRTSIVDSNIERILTRLFLLSDTNMKQLQIVGDSLIPYRGSREFNWAMLDLAAAVCRYDFPRCNRCPLRELCSTGMASSP